MIQFYCCFDHWLTFDAFLFQETNMYFSDSIKQNHWKWLENILIYIGFPNILKWQRLMNTCCFLPANVSWQSMKVVRLALTKARGPSCWVPLFLFIYARPAFKSSKLQGGTKWNLLLFYFNHDLWLRWKKITHFSRTIITIFTNHLYCRFQF